MSDISYGFITWKVQSRPYFMQVVGRTMWTVEGKDKVVVVDHAGGYRAIYAEMMESF